MTEDINGVGSGSAISVHLTSFLERVVTAERGFFCLSLAQASGINWADQWFIWPDDRTKIVACALKYADTYNVYFSTYLFKAQNRTKENVVAGTRTIQADLDEAVLDNIPIKPTLIVETSPHRHQAYWILSEALDLDTHETLSRKITYAIDKADHSGWPLGRTARMPFTQNFKYIDGPKPVSITLGSTSAPDTEIEPISFELLGDVDNPSYDIDEQWITSEKVKPTVGPNELLDGLLQNKKITAKIVLQYNQVADDRSDALWALMLALFRAGCARDTVFWVARESANNKFKRLRYGGDKELSKDVLRAESVAQRKITDVRAHIREIRRMPGPSFIRSDAITKEVQDILQSEGDFLHTTDNNLWYVKRDTGKPILVGRNSEQFVSLLDIHFGLNRSETEQTYVKDAIMSHIVNLPANTEISAISHYHAAGNFLLLHSGMRDVLKITDTDIFRFPNGSNNILFPWNMENEVFIPDFGALPSEQTWSDILFQGAFDNVVDMKPEEASALMRVWTMFILFRTAAFTRPILAYIGQPGSGKTTAMRRLYRLLYGVRKDPLKAKVEEHLDIASTKDPFIFIDNVDTWQPWLPDWLATTISNMDIVKRKLYSDGDVFTLKRQAIVGLTAHNPKFGREDVADRLLLVTFHRLASFGNEAEILDNISRNRNRLWGAIIKDAQKVLQEPLATAEESPQFRIQDFAIVGLRIARALGVETDFVAGIRAVTQEQKLFSLEEESILVNAIRTMIEMDAKKDRHLQERTAGVLWSELELYSGNSHIFTKIYRDAVRLSKKLQAMQVPLSQVYNINRRFDNVNGTWVWSFGMKNGVVSAEQLAEIGKIEKELAN